MMRSHGYDEPVTNKTNVALSSWPLAAPSASEDQTADSTRTDIKLFHSIHIVFFMRDTNAWMLAADTRLFFSVHNQIFKDQKVRRFKIPRLFCLCCHGSYLDYCKKQKPSCVHEYEVAVTTSAWWAPIERWSKLYDSARTAPNEIWSWSCSCVQSGSPISWHTLSFHFTASFISQPHLCPN